MKTIYKMLLMALVMLVMGNKAMAETYSGTVEWNIPDAAKVYVGMGTSAQYPAIGADRLSCTFSYDNFSSAPWLYVEPSDASKYYIKGVWSVDGAEETPLAVNNVTKANISTANYNGKKIRVEFAEIILDSEFTIRVINGRDKFNEKIPQLLGGSTVNLTLKTGDNKIQFASGYHTGVTVRAAVYDENTSPYYHEDAYVKINGEPGTLSGTKYMTTFLNNQAIHNGDVFEIRYWDVDDEVDAAGPYTVTINADELGAKAINMIFNQTKKQSISERDQFEVDADNVFSITCNTYDYTVTVNGERLADNPDILTKYTVWYSDPVTEDLTVNISAVEREYGTTDVKIAVVNPDGIDLLPGYQDAEPVDLSGYTSTPVTFQGVEYQQYVIPVTNKSCKIFTAVKEGYWLKSSLDSEGEEAYIATPDQIIYVNNPKLNINARIGFYVECGEDLNGFQGTIANVGLYDAALGGEAYAIHEGMNYFDVDLSYVNGQQGEGMRVRPFGINFEDDTDLGIKANPFYVYQNFTACSRDDNDVYHVIVNDKDIIRVYIGVPATIYNVPVSLGPNSDLQVTLDGLQEIDMTAYSFQAFAGQSASVSSASNRAFCLGTSVDDEDADVFSAGDGVFNFKFGSRLKAIFEPRADMAIVTTQDGTVDNLSAVVVEFPGAKSAKAVLSIDEVMVRKNDWNWAPSSISLEEVTGAEVPTFRFVLTPDNAPFGDYTILVPEGFFVVTGDDDATRDNVDFYESFTYTSAVSQEDLAITFDPTNDNVLNDSGVMVTAVLDERYSFPNSIDTSKITVTFNGNAVTSYQHAVEGNYLMFLFPVTGEGTLTVEFAEGVALIEGVATPSASKSWNVVAKKEYAYELIPSLDATVSSLSTLTLSFPEAKTGELFWANGFALKNSDYSYTNYSPVVTQVENAAVPTFTITFSPAPTADGNYKLTIMQGVFLLDGCQSSSLIEKEFAISAETGVVDSIGSDVNATVISIDGRMIMQDASANDLRSLERGIYIINGKKVIIK